MTTEDKIIQLQEHAGKSTLMQRHFQDILFEGVDKLYRLNRGSDDETTFIATLWATFGMNPSLPTGQSKMGRCIIATSLRNALATHGQYNNAFRTPKDVIVEDEHKVKWTFVFNPTYFDDVNSGLDDVTKYGLNDSTEGFKNFDFQDVGETPQESVKNADTSPGSWTRQPFSNIDVTYLNWESHRRSVYSDAVYHSLQFENYKFYISRLNDSEDGNLTASNNSGNLEWRIANGDFRWYGELGDTLIYDFGPLANASWWAYLIADDEGVCNYEYSDDNITYYAITPELMKQLTDLAVAASHLYIKIAWASPGNFRGVGLLSGGIQIPNNYIQEDQSNPGNFYVVQVDGGVVVANSVTPKPLP